MWLPALLSPFHQPINQYSCLFPAQIPAKMIHLALDAELASVLVPARAAAGKRRDVRRACIIRVFVTVLKVFQIGLRQPLKSGNDDFTPSHD